jgi:alkylation response protein AidB-like acyl-CoA dehydrogenase
MTDTLSSPRRGTAAGAASEMARTGMYGWSLAREHGGDGLAPAEVAHRLLALGATIRDASSLFAASAQLWAVQYPIEIFGSATQRERYLPRLLDGALTGAHATTEPDAGTDVGALRCWAAEHAGGFVIDGRKTFVTNAPCADVFVVVARTGPSPVMGLTAFVVDRLNPGVSTTAPMQVAGGLATAPLGDVVFDGCHVGPDAVLGPVGQGLRVFLTAMQAERLFILAPPLGAAKAELLQGVRSRRTGDRPAHRAAVTEVLVAEQVLLRAASAFRFGASIDWRCSLVKLAAVRALDAVGRTMATTDQADRLFEAHAAAIYSGTTHVQLELLARHLGLPD